MTSSAKFTDTQAVPDRLAHASRILELQSWLRKRIFELLVDTEDFDPDESLIYYGLDSIRAMQIASELQAHGVRLSLADLATKPSLNQWQQLIERDLGSR